jgi:hypothetical protein
MWEKIKQQALEWVQWAERELSGKSGSEKRKAVVSKLCDVIDIPMVPGFVEAIFEPIVYGWVVDKVCNVLNILTDGDFKDVVLTQEQQLKVVALVNVKPDGESEKEAVAPSGGDIDARLNDLYERYGVKN